MSKLNQRWTPDQLLKMNEESFMVEVLDMIKFSPEIDDTDAQVNTMKQKLTLIEEMIQTRLATKK
ncbi:hypothetical protein DN062_14420 [Nitrincola tibetensis]|jgi:hypothetical protein|uniref:Uncharacterized protein n=1 Tax=Nitrincola tibetensis TaxID=2219697 RepID=A0A364NJ65_9GAMM|nr:hypothetical protein [Nitrincola tibetensis]RAU17106.1 hypothetical protein DN062_14420 [Nitrincola tibetensis]